LKKVETTPPRQYLCFLPYSEEPTRRPGLVP
jgi:hypothetical protein